MLPSTRIVIDGKRYATKYFLFRTRWWNVSLHIFHRPDYGRHFHNHPWDGTAYSFILWGGYREEYLHTIDHPFYVTRKHRWFNKIHPACFHRITQLFRRPTVTLFVTPRRRKQESWGFLVRDQYYHHRFVVNHTQYNADLHDNHTFDNGYKEAMHA